MPEPTAADQRPYWCFISYRHADNRQQDRSWASWIHREIERFEVPGSLVGTKNGRGDVIPKRIYPVFRDEESLPADSDLANSIVNALNRSKFLVVLCSPRAVESKYVAQEIEHFKSRGMHDRIITAIIDGEPGSANRECFPAPLLPGSNPGQMEFEPIAADFRLPSGEEGFTTAAAYREVLLKSGFSRQKANEEAQKYEDRLQLMKLKVIAGILGIGLDQLRNRDQAFQLELARRKARIQRRLTLAFAVFAAVALVAGFIAKVNGDRAEENATHAKENANRAEENADRASRNLLQAYTVQGVEKAEQGNYGESAAYFAQSLRHSDALKSADTEPVRMRLTSMVRQGRFAILEQLLDHGEKVAAIDVSPVGRYVATSSDDGRVRLWNFETRQQVADLKRDPNLTLPSLAFAQDDSKVALASGNLITIYKTVDGQRLQEPIVLQAPILHLRFNSSGDALFALIGENDRSQSVIVDLASGTPAWVVDNQQGFEKQGFVSPGGRWAVVDNNLIRLNVPYGAARKLPFDGISRVAFFGNEKYAYVEAAGIHLFDLEAFRSIPIFDESDYDNPTKLFEHVGHTGKLSVSLDGRFLMKELVWELTGERDTNQIVAIGFPSPEEAQFEESNRIMVDGSRKTENRDLYLSPSGQLLAANAGRGALEILDTSSHRVISAKMQHSGLVNAVRFSLDESRLLTAASDRYLRIWRIDALESPAAAKNVALPSRSHRWMPNFYFMDDLEQGENSSSIHYSHDKKWKLVTNIFQEGVEGPADVEIGPARGELKRFREPWDFISMQRFSPSGTYCYYRGERYDSKTEQSVAETILRKSATGELVRNYSHLLVGISNDERLGVVASDVGATVVDLLSGAPVYPEIRLEGEIALAVFDRTSQYLALGLMGSNKATSAWGGVWHLESGTRVLEMDHMSGWLPDFLEESYEFTEGTQSVVGLQFSPDSRFIVSLTEQTQMDGDREFMGSQPRRARIWDLQTGLPATEWLEVQGRHTLPDADSAPLKHPLDEHQNILQMLAVDFSETGRELIFRIGNKIIQQVHYDSDISAEELIELAETLGGSRFDDKQSRLVPLSEKDRIESWKSLQKSAAAMDLVFPYRK